MLTQICVAIWRHERRHYVCSGFSHCNPCWATRVDGLWQRPKLSLPSLSWMIKFLLIVVVVVINTILVIVQRANPCSCYKMWMWTRFHPDNFPHSREPIAVHHGEIQTAEGTSSYHNLLFDLWWSVTDLVADWSDQKGNRTILPCKGTQGTSRHTGGPQPGSTCHRAA